MKVFIDKLIEKSADLLIGAVAGLIIIIAGMIGPKIIPALSPVLSKELLLTALTLSVLINLALLVTVLVLSRKEKLTYKFGILWGKDLVPHCPSCKGVLGQYAKYHIQGWGFQCMTCNKIIKLYDKSGKEISWEVAEKSLRT